MNTRIQTGERSLMTEASLQRLCVRTRQIEKNVTEIIEDHRLVDFLVRLEKYQAEYAAAEPTTQLTDEDFDVIEEAKSADRRRQKRLWLRNLLKDIVRHSGTNSEPCRKAIEALELLDRIEAGESRLWAQLDTLVFIIMEMCRAEDQNRKESADKSAGTEQKATSGKCRQAIRWLKDHPHSYGLTGSLIFLILFLLLGLLKAQWRNWCWGTAVIAFLVLVLSLLGGKSSR
jgi:hypothetical protein